MSGREHGGPVESGSVFTVGENGPETLVVGSGMVIPNAELREALEKGRLEIKVEMDKLRKLLDDAEDEQ